MLGLACPAPAPAEACTGLERPCGLHPPPLEQALGALGGLLRGAPDLRLPLASGPRPAPPTWLLNTYLDGGLRITRGDKGSLYVLVKEQPGGEAASAAAAPGGASGAAAVPGYWGSSGAGAEGRPDWEAIEEQEPPAAVADPVVEPSAVVEGSGSNGSPGGAV